VIGEVAAGTYWHWGAEILTSTSAVSKDGKECEAFAKLRIRWF